MGIKGPKSALTDFLEEKGIKVKYTQKRKKEEPETLLVTKSNKKIYESKPFELVNHKKFMPNLQTLCLKKIYENFSFDQQIEGVNLNLFAKFLAENNFMTVEFFNYLIDQSEESLKIYDCSMIKNENFNFKKTFKKIELVNCGQMTEESANNLLKNNINLEELSLKGAFQLKKIILPKKLKILILDDTKVDDEFIKYLNKTYKKLDELSLQRCYNLKNCTLEVKVKHLNISNTLLNGNFLVHFSDLECLNISNCNFMLDFTKLTNLKHLFLENYFYQTNLTNELISLQLKNCTNINLLNNFTNLEYLDISGLNLEKNELLKIKEFKKLKILNLSWNENVNDSIINELINNLNLEELIVYGCFNLTEQTGALAYKIFLQTKIIGNPAETNFLINQTQSDKFIE